MGYSPWGLKELNMTEHAHTHTHTHTHTRFQVGSLSNSQKGGRGGGSINLAYRWYVKAVRTDEKRPEKVQFRG